MSHLFSVRQMALALVALGILAFTLPAAAGEQRPIRGAAEETVTDETPLEGDLVLLTITATGEATHLGRFTGTETVISSATVSGTFTFVGGTGRFQHASGQADLEVVTPDDIHLILTFKGTIEY